MPAALFQFSSFHFLGAERRSRVIFFPGDRWVERCSLSFSLCGFIRGNEGQWLEVIPFFQLSLRTTARVLIIIKSLTNRGSASRTIQFLALPFLTTILFLKSPLFSSFLSFSSIFFYPFPCFTSPLSFSLFLSVSLSFYGPNRFPLQLSQSQTRDWST